jgi:enamine deaminase RidA (YjgF/YER057c/UK114 family)
MFTCCSRLYGHTRISRLLQPMSRVVISSPLAPAAIGPYSQAIKVNGMIYVSGCLPMADGKIVEGGK